MPARVAGGLRPGWQRMVNVNINHLVTGYVRSFEWLTGANAQKGTRTMFDLEVESDLMTQVRHIKSDATVIIRHGTNKYEVAPGFNSDAPINVDGHQAVEALVADARKWIAERRGVVNRGQPGGSRRG